MKSSSLLSVGCTPHLHFGLGHFNREITSKQIIKITTSKKNRIVP